MLVKSRTLTLSVVQRNVHREISVDQMGLHATPKIGNVTMNVRPS